MIIIKKILIIIAITITFIAYDSTNNKDNIVIPDTAIRLRVIPNSNTIEDQTQKQVIKNTIENYIANNLTDLNNINDAKNTIKNNLDNLKKEIDKTIKDKNYNVNYTIKYGQNYFPKKQYKGITYNEGYYESLVITLGNGKGDNWWCVLFPPLCLLDNENQDEVEYKFLVKELLDKIFWINQNLLNKI